MTDFLMVLVTLVIVLRLPAVRSAQQRPLWLMLVVLEIGQLAALPVVAKVIDGTAGVPQLANLVRGLTAVALATALLHLAVHLHSAENGAPKRLGLRLGLAAFTVAGQITCFCLAIASGDQLRPGFAPTPGSVNWVMGYWFFFLPYMIGARFTASVLFWRLLPRVRSLLPRLGILLLALATSVSVVYLLSRVGSLFSTARWLRDIGHYASGSSFALLAFGASLAALAPLRESFVDWLDCRRLHPLWHDLCTAFPHIALHPSGSIRTRLHRRIVEIRDGMLSLREWITPEDDVDGDSAEATVRWIRLALQRMRAGEPKSPVVLDLVRQGGTDTETELRWLRELARAYRSSADDALPGPKDRAHVE